MLVTVTPAEIVTARVTDGPWGPLLGALAGRSFTGEIAIDAAGKRYAIELRRGVVITASSPLASDSVVRVALTSHLITPVHIATVSRALASAGKRDEIDVVAEVAHLSAEQVSTLRTRAVTQRAARTFAVDDGAVTIKPAPPRSAGEVEIEIAAVIFLGARMNLSETRLGNDLRRLGGKFALAPGADTLLPRFGFGAEGVAIANLIRGGDGLSLAELEAAHREIDPRVAAATIYALVSCGAAIATVPGRADAPVPQPPRARSEVIVPRTMTPPVVSRTMTPPALQPAVSRTMTPPAEPPVVSRTMTPPPVSRTPTPDGMTLRTPTSPPATGRASSPAISRTITPRWTAEALAELEEIVASRLAMIEQGADYFAVLGLVVDAPVEAVRAAYNGLSRRLQPEALAQHATPALAIAGARLREHVDNAHAVLTDPARRGAYVAALTRGGDAVLGTPRTRTRTEDERTPVDEAVHRGMLAMRANQPERAAVELARAVELDPGNVDHAVMLAWARFCAATDKGTAAVETRRVLLAASRSSDKPALATFYLGRVERMLGRDKEALQLFHDALDLDPANLEAAAEVRVLEARLAGGQRRR